MELLNNIRQFVSLNEDEIQSLIARCEKMELKRNESFLRMYDVCRKVAYVEKGALVYLRTNASGEELAVDFAFENDWVTYLYSLLTENPADMEIRAQEETVLITISKKNLYELYERIPRIERMGRILAEKSFIELAERTHSLQARPAAERYEALLQSKPHILERMPQYYIASYLGIKPQSLSRLRKMK
jgi:CRP-like cAMP-binding protein